MSSSTLDRPTGSIRRQVAAFAGPLAVWLVAGAVIVPLLSWAQRSSAPAPAAAPRVDDGRGPTGSANSANPAITDDEALADALEELLRGVPERAEPILRALADRGNVLAMERLALMFWYGDLLYPGIPRDRNIAAAWAALAARNGSELGERLQVAAMAARELEARAQADSETVDGSPAMPSRPDRQPGDDVIVEWR